jgi:hypothetical protein
MGEEDVGIDVGGPGLEGYVFRVEGNWELES